MAIDVRGIIDYDLASHLFDAATKNGKFKYFIDDKAKFLYEGHVEPIKMTKQDVAYIDSVMLGIGQMTGLTPTRDKKGNKSTFDIQKFDFGVEGDVLGYMYPESWGVFLTFSDAYDTAELNNLTRETIDHEIGHGIGLGHPYGDGFNNAYSTFDTVMSYNDILYENDEQVYLGFTPSDDAAISYWWGNANYRKSGNPAKVGGSLKIKSNPLKADGHSHDSEDATHGIETFSVSEKSIKTTSRHMPGYTNNEELDGPFILDLSDDDNKIDSRKWDDNVAKNLTNYGRIGIHANAGNDTFIVGGDKLASTGGFKFSLSGGVGRDKMIVKNIDNITGDAGLLFGFNRDNKDIPRSITLHGFQGDNSTITDGNATKMVETSSAIVIWEDIEVIKLAGTKISFDELYDILDGADSTLLTELV